MRKRLRPAAEPEVDLVGREVSCGVLTALLASTKDMGLDEAELIGGTGYPAAHYADPTERVSWSAFQVIMERVGDRLTDDQLRAIGAASIGIQHFEPQIILARLLLRPVEAYSFIIRGDGHGDLACLGATITIDKQIVSIEVTIAEGYDHAPALFSILAGAAEELPTFFGLPPATVEVQRRGQGVHLVVDVPPGGGRWSLVDRLRRRVMRIGRNGEVRDRLMQRTWALETSAAKRLAIEADLKAALGEHRRRLANMNDVVVELDGDGRTLFVSPNLEAVLGVAESDFVGDAWAYLQPPDELDSTSWITNLEQTDRWIEVNPSGYGGEDRSELLLVVRDVTDRVELAAQLSTSRRLESLGVMATGVAHDFNNLLVPIVGNIGSILDELSEDSPVLERAQSIETAARLSSQLVDQILATTGRSLPHDETCDVAHVVASMTSLLTEMVDPAIDLRVESVATAPARVDADSLGQLLTNLVLNADQAIDGEGQIRVEVEQPSAEEVVLSVADDGAGMAPEASERMTEPFFTTRPGGRGLGLASLAGMLHAGRATFSVTTELDRGTSVRVVFSSAPVHVDLTVEDRPRALPRRDARLLLVDDDDLVRSTVESILSPAFGSISSLASARDALVALGGDSPFDCLVTDMTMPDIRGPELIAEARRLRPGIPVVLITGAGGRKAQEELIAVGIHDIRVVSKPFTPAALVEAVQYELGRKLPL